MSMEDFQVLKELGKGSFGQVVKVMRKSDKQIYAMKIIKIKRLKQSQKLNALNQIRFLASINHINIVSYCEAFYNEDTQSLCIVMQYANQGDLAQLIKRHDRSKIRIKESFIWKMAYQLLQGLNRLHEAKIIHRDIKPANIFFNDSVAKIGDLNVSKHLTDPFTVTQTGTPFYAAPEVWNQEPYDFKSDIWSLGCIIYETACLKPPFVQESPERLHKKVISGEYDPIPPNYSKQLAELINKALNINQNQRPNCKQLLSYIQKTNNLYIAKQDEVQSNNKLLQTIKFPKNLKQLNNNLPKSQYNLCKSVKNCKSTKIIQNQSQNKLQNKLEQPCSLKLIQLDENVQNLKIKRKNQIYL